MVCHKKNTKVPANQNETKNSMRVFYIDPQSYNNLSVYDYSLLDNVHGHEVTYFYSDNYQCDHLPGQHQYCVFHYNSKSNVVAKGLSYVWSIIRILWQVITKRPDVIHVQWLRIWHLDYAFAWLSKKMGARLIFTAHNILPHTPKASDTPHFRKYYRLVDKIIVHNNRTRNELTEFAQVSPEKVKVILHGVFPSHVDNDAVQQAANAIKAHIGIKEGDTVFSCLGVQNKYKGTELVLRLWADTPALHNNPRCHLLVVGRNQNVDYSIAEGIANVFILNEMISDIDFEAYLQISSVVLLPYLNISQSGLLFSAVNAGVPTLVSDVGGLTEPLNYGKIGWNLQAPTIENLQEAVLYLLEHPEEIEHVRNDAAAFESVREVYSWEKIGEVTSLLYDTAGRGE